MDKKRGKTAKSSSNNSSEHPSSVEVIIKKKIFGEAPKEHHFILADGRKIKNIMQMADAFETMSEEIFRHHANEMKNDFSTWVKDIFYDHSLAEDISRAKNKLEAQVAVLRRIIKELM